MVYYKNYQFTINGSPESNNGWLCFGRSYSHIKAFITWKWKEVANWRFLKFSTNSKLGRMLYLLDIVDLLGIGLLLSIVFLPPGKQQECFPNIQPGYRVELMPRNWWVPWPTTPCGCYSKPTFWRSVHVELDKLDIERKESCCGLLSNSSLRAWALSILLFCTR